MYNLNNMNMGKIVIVGNQKGGVGKSTITAMMASHLHFKLEKKVLVIDGDDLQQSLSKIREREGGESYELVKSTTREIPGVVDNLKNIYDYIFIDIPGNLKQEGVVNTLLTCDKVVVPVSISELDIDSTKDFIGFLKNTVEVYKEKIGQKIDIMGVFNKVNIQTVEYRQVKDLDEIMGVKFCKIPIKNSVNIARGVSTIDMDAGEYIGLMEELTKFLEEERQ